MATPRPLGGAGLLPPIPDELIVARDRERMIRWLGDQNIPPVYRAKWLREWGAYTGVPVGKADLVRVQSFP